MSQTSFGDNEQILSAIPVRLKTGLFSSESYHLVLTNQRLIFAIFHTKMLKKEVTDASEKAKEEGKSIWGRLFTAMGAREAFAKRYLVMKPKEVLAEDVENFYCEHHLIHRIESKKGHNAYHTDGEYKGQEATKIIIKTADVTYKLEVENQADTSEFSSYLKNIFSKKFKEK